MRWTPDQWRRVNDLFGEAADAPPGQRDALLDASSDDALLIAEVRRLLAQHDRTGGLLDRTFQGAGLLRDAMKGSSLKPGALLLNRFRIERLIGEGGMGEVYEAEDIELRVRIAIKTIRPEVASEPRVIRRFKQEIQLSRRITHPNVCRVFDLARDGDLTFLTMELLEGETLAQRLKRAGRFTEEEALPIVRQLVAALAAAHDAGIIHRDFKSNNVMLSGAKAVVVDFGLSRSLSPEQASAATRTGFPVGTPAYMAPEQIEGGELGPYTDIYALGVVLFEMMTGSQPFQGPSPMAQAVKRVKEVARSPRELRPELSDRWALVIMRCLEYKPEDRFQNAGEVLAALEGGKLKAAAKTPVRPRRTLAIGGAAAVLALGAVSFLTLRYPAEPAEAARRWYLDGVTAIHDGAYETARKQLEYAAGQDPRFAKIHARLAETYLELDALDLARDEALKAVQLERRGWFGAAADRYYFDGMQATVLRDAAGSVAAFEKLAGVAPERLKTEALMDLARAYDRADQREKALAAYERVLKRDAENPAAHLRLAVILARKDGMAAAGSHFEEAAKGYERRSNNEGKSEVAYQRGVALRQKKLSDAEAQFRLALDLAAEHPQQRVKILYQIGALIAGTRADGAREFVAQGIKLAEASRMENLVAQGWIETGNLYLARAKPQYAEAEPYFRRALEIAKRSMGRKNEARAAGSLANVLDGQQRTSEGQAYLNQALTFYREGGYPVQLSQTLRILASFQEKQGKVEEAVRTLIEQADRAEKAGEVTQVAEIDFKIGSMIARKAKILEAIPYLRRAEDLFGKAENWDRQFSTQVSTASWLNDVGDFKRSNDTLERAEGIAEKLGHGAKDKIALTRAESAIMRMDGKKALEFESALRRLFESEDTERAIKARLMLCAAMGLAGKPAGGNGVGGQARRRQWGWRASPPAALRSAATAFERQTRVLTPICGGSRICIWRRFCCRVDGSRRRLTKPGWRTKRR